jgi:ankyrin repeat protein
MGFLILGQISNPSFISTSQLTVEKKLDQLIKEFREGRREGSIISTQTVDSICEDDKSTWRAIRKELEDMGITVSAFEANKGFIFDWFVKAIGNGDFEEQVPEADSPNALAESPDGITGSPAIQHDTRIPLQRSSLEQSSPSGSPITKLTHLQPTQTRARVPRITALFARFTAPGKELKKAIDADNIEKVKRILDNDVKFRLIDEEGFGKTLCYVAEKGKLEIMKLFVGTIGIDMNSKDSCGYTAFQAAAQYGRLDVVKLLIATNGIDLDSKDMYGRTAFTSAAAGGQLDIVSLLIATKGIDLKSQDEFGRTALASAARYGHINIIKLLVEMNAVDSTSESKEGPMAFIEAAARDYHDILKLLVAVKCIDLQSKDRNGDTALTGVARLGNANALILLLGMKGLNINLRNNFGDTALIKAATFGRTQVVGMLVATTGVDLNAKNIKGKTALMEAIPYQNLTDEDISWDERESFNTTKLLIQTPGVDLNARDNSGMTALHHAVCQGQQTVARLLIDAGADQEIKDSRGRTAQAAGRNTFSWSHYQRPLEM